MSILGIEPGSSAKATHALNCWANSPVHGLSFRGFLLIPLNILKTLKLKRFKGIFVITQQSLQALSGEAGTYTLAKCSWTAACRYYATEYCFPWISVLYGLHLMEQSAWFNWINLGGLERSKGILADAQNKFYVTINSGLQLLWILLGSRNISSIF